ncbi:hypothetical protein A6B37_12930 [Achromobacter sp. HZ01]|uniref:Succinate--CoA ligase subunit alpha n=1 Tax=Achromobacter pulmonis TaxID=1389932 RepID=A0A2N8KJI9_9BURK|nr:MULTISPECIES: succinate--CoA ligase subunit alpha [Achromobacter]PND33616.1 succinate--CoA ligase subunit alpha [Achromobacter pulmonis]RAP63327.1 hypothetical protein A6B37_12930 [Achromobacter sp. HZ01]
MLFDMDRRTPVIVQGITGRMGRMHADLMRRYGTNIVGGTGSVEKGEEDALPVSQRCAEIVERTGAQASIAIVPPAAVPAAVQEAVAAGIKLIVTVAEGIPVHEAVRLRALTRDAGVTWIGPSTPGLCVPGEIKLGFLPDAALAPGCFGVMSKSGTLSYEVGRRMREKGLGQSLWIGVGGDPVKGTRFGDLAQGLLHHGKTQAIVLIGEIGGNEEEEFAGVWQALGGGKPVYALIAGAQAKEGIPMGHAGALVMGQSGSLESKRASLQQAGAQVFDTIQAMLDAMARDFAPAASRL